MQNKELNLEFNALMNLIVEKEKQIEDINTKMFLKSLEKIE